MDLPPKDERDPITNDEFILRRIHSTHYKPGLPDPILRVAFEPKAGDHDGGSFNRESFVTAEALAYSGRKPGEYYIARFSVARLRGAAFSLAIEPSPDPDPASPRGHCVVRELSIDAYQADRGKSKSLQLGLAKLAKEDIVFVPPGCSR